MTHNVDIIVFCFRFQASGVSGLPHHCGEVGGGGRALGRCCSNSNKSMGGTLLEKDPTYSQPMTSRDGHQAHGYNNNLVVNGKRTDVALNSKAHETTHDGSKIGNAANVVGKAKSNLNERISLSPHSTRVAAVGALAAIRAQADANRRPNLKNELEPPASLAPPAHNMSARHDHNNSSALGGGSGGALIVHPGLGKRDTTNSLHGGLAMVHVPPKSRILDIGKRRVRRPFSVAEVEALVHAVEKLGTGRYGLHTSMTYF